MRFFLLCATMLLSYLSLFASDIAMVTLAVDEKNHRVSDTGINNKKAYCEKYGYDFICSRELLDPSLPLSSNKILLIQKVMNENPSYHWIFWSDANSLIMNSGISLDFFVDEGCNFLTAKHYDAPPLQIVQNAEQFFLKNCDWSKRYLAGVLQVTSRQRKKTFQHETIDWRSSTKLVPTRLFCSFGPNSAVHDNNSVYQPGDFIIQFPNTDPTTLKNLFDQYQKSVEVNAPFLTLDHYLSIYEGPNFLASGERAITPAQREQFKTQYAQSRDVAIVVEIGSSAYSSVALFYSGFNDLENFIYFDSFENTGIKTIQDYFTKKDSSAFTFIKGETETTIPKYFRSHPWQKADIIFIDGVHSYHSCLNDIYFSQALARPNTKLWINNSHLPPIKNAIRNYVDHGVLEIISNHESHDPEGYRCWAEARFIDLPVN